MPPRQRLPESQPTIPGMPELERQVPRTALPKVTLAPPADTSSEQSPLFEITSETPNADDLLSLDELVLVVAERRRKALAEKATTQASSIGAKAVEATVEPVEVKKRSYRKGGAFGGALKRRILETDSAEKAAATNQFDVELLIPTNLKKELFEVSGDRVYEFPGHPGRRNKVLMTADEYMGLTLSPSKLAGRVGANVISHTKDRLPTAQHEREAEVQQKALTTRIAAAKAQSEALAIDDDVFSTLLKQMRSPGFAHMRQEEMDALMAHAEGVFVDMFKAIIQNHKAPTERVVSLTAALDYLLSSDDYRTTFAYWQEMSKLGQRWTRLKATAFNGVVKKLGKEYEERFGQKPIVA